MEVRLHVDGHPISIQRFDDAIHESKSGEDQNRAGWQWHARECAFFSWELRGRLKRLKRMRRTTKERGSPTQLPMAVKRAMKTGASVVPTPKSALRESSIVSTLLGLRSPATELRVGTRRPKPRPRHPVAMRSML